MNYKEEIDGNQSINDNEHIKETLDIPTTRAFDLVFLVDEIKKLDDENEVLEKLDALSSLFQNTFLTFSSLEESDFDSFLVNFITHLLEIEHQHWTEALNTYTNYLFRFNKTKQIPEEFYDRIIQQFQIVSDQLRTRIEEMENINEGDDYEGEPKIIPNDIENISQQISLSSDAASILVFLDNIFHDFPEVLNAFVNAELHTYFPFYIQNFPKNHSITTAILSTLEKMLDYYQEISYYQDSFSALQETNLVFNENFLRFVLCAVDTGQDFCFFFDDREFYMKLANVYDSDCFDLALRICIIILKTNLEETVPNIASVDLPELFTQTIIIKTNGLTSKNEAPEYHATAHYYQFLRNLLRRNIDMSKLYVFFKDDFTQMLNNDMTNASYEIRMSALKFSVLVTKRMEPVDISFLYMTNTLLHILENYDCEDTILLYYTSQFLLNVVNAGLHLPPDVNMPKHNPCFGADAKTSQKLNFFTLAHHLDSEDFAEAISQDINEDTPEDYLELTNELHDRVMELIEMHSTIIFPLNSEGLIDLDFGLSDEINQQTNKALFGDFGWDDDNEFGSENGVNFIGPMPY